MLGSWVALLTVVNLRIKYSKNMSIYKANTYWTISNTVWTKTASV